MKLPVPNRQGQAPAYEGQRVLLADCVDIVIAAELYRPRDPIQTSTISAKIRDGSVIAYLTDDGDYRVPSWQFRSGGGLLPGIAKTLEVLKAAKTYTQITPFAFFRQENPMTQNLTPLDALREGKIAAVLSAAREYAG